MIKLGCNNGQGRIFEISDTVVNKDIILVGEKGSGKTVAMKSIEKNLVREGHLVLILNIDGTHNDILSNAEGCYAVNVKSEGIPMPLLEGFSDSDSSWEDSIDICEAVVDVLSQVDSIGYHLQWLLAKACEKAVMVRAGYEDDMECLHNSIISLEEKEKTELLAKYRNVFNRVKFHKKFDLWRPDKATIFDFSGYSHSMQLLIAQLVISVLWRYHRIYGQYMAEGTWVVLDEFQNFPLRDNSLLAQILREGRKYNLSLLLATQTLSSFEMSKRAILQQPGTKLYFHPVEADLRKISKSVSNIKPLDAEIILRNLKKGECLADGEFVIAGKNSRRALKISLRPRVE